jgi:hypothetical protein
MPNLQILQLQTSLIEPNVLLLTWNIISGEDPNINTNYIINYTDVLNGITNQVITTNMSVILNLSNNTTYNIRVISVDVGGFSSNPSNIVTNTTSSPRNLIGLSSGLRPFNKLLSFQLNTERMCDNLKVISQYPSFIDITKKPFYQYYRIQKNI